ncbi:MAG: 16S rRNA (adenine(1518)-N(6)/adenine(1519)-N(6))-dimethyltransferase RsmA [Alkalinema sp. RU_4_3]|nr:16S rRNA (adenine(1518)-N(6)/adenine(1519)-N(6))-dimethyltransferase RsmA [Alkalinema sp. RU_4_3]
MVKTRKQFGQHWLKSEKALDKIVWAAELSKEDSLLEIGPGTGILTAKLLPLAKTVLAVELDRDLCPLLVKKFGAVSNFLLMQGDFLDLNISGLAPAAFFPNNKVVANIPYNITGPILTKLLGTISNPNPTPYDSIVLLMQKEVALRLCANAGNHNYGALSVRVQYLADCEFICDVPAKAFQPPPKVDSAVVRIKPRPIAIPAQDPKALEKLIKLSFATKRKMLRNNLKSIIPVEALNELLIELDLNPQARAEDFALAEWVRFSDRFGQWQINSPQP